MMHIAMANLASVLLIAVKGQRSSSLDAGPFSLRGSQT